jgi:hypothetical protein
LEEVVLGQTENLLKVEHWVAHVVHLFESFCFVKVSLTEGPLCQIFFSHLCEAIEIFQRILILL